MTQKLGWLSNGCHAAKGGKKWQIWNILFRDMSTGWRRLIGRLKLQVIFRKRATNYRAVLRKMTYEDMASYDSTPLCRDVIAVKHSSGKLIGGYGPWLFQVGHNGKKEREVTGFLSHIPKKRCRRRCGVAGQLSQAYHIVQPGAMGWLRLVGSLKL